MDCHREAPTTRADGESGTGAVNHSKQTYVSVVAHVSGEELVVMIDVWAVALLIGDLCTSIVIPASIQLLPIKPCPLVAAPRRCTRVNKKQTKKEEQSRHDGVLPQSEYSRGAHPVVVSAVAKLARVSCIHTTVPVNDGNTPCVVLGHVYPTSHCWPSNASRGGTCLMGRFQWAKPWQHTHTHTHTHTQGRSVLRLITLSYT